MKVDEASVLERAVELFKRTVNPAMLCVTVEMDEEGQPRAWERAGAFQSLKKDKDYPVNCKCVITKSVLYESHVEIRFSHEVEHEDKKDRDIKVYALYISRVNFDGATAVTPVKEMNDEDLVDLMADCNLPGEFVDEKDHWSEISMKIKPKPRQASGIFNCNDTGDFEDSRRKILGHINMWETHHSSVTLRFLVRSNNLTGNVRAWELAVEASLSDHPLKHRVSHFNPNRPLFIEPNDFADDPPNLEENLHYRVSFFDRIDHHFIVGSGARIEHDAETRPYLRQLEGKAMRFAQIASAGDRRYMAYMAFDDLKFKLSKDDRIEATFPDGPPGAHPWIGHVVEADAANSLGSLSFAITRYQDENGNWDDRTIQAADWHKMAGLPLTRQLIESFVPTFVNIKFLIQEEPFRRERTAMLALWENQKYDGLPQEILLANNPSELPVIDAYSNIDVPDEQLDKVLYDHARYTPEQHQAAAMLRSVPGGVALREGAGGTGKSYWAIQSTLPIIMHPTKEGGYKQRLLYVVNLNAAVNDATRKIDEACEAYRRHHGLATRAIVVRCHAYETSRRQVEQPFSKDNREPILQDLEGIQDTLANLIGASAILRQHQEKFKTLLGIGDRTLTEERNSLGWWMSVVAGLNDEHIEGININKDAFEELRTLLETAAHGSGLEPDFKKQVTQLVRSLQATVLANATAIVMTANRAADHRFVGVVVSAVIIVDEAPLLTEHQILPVFAYYSSAFLRILTGDTFQNHPVITSREKYNFAHQQLKVTPFVRLRDAGY